MQELQAINESINESTISFDGLLESFLHTSLRASLREVQQQAVLVPEEMRLRAWHLLSYALRTGKAWQETRELLTTLAPKMEQAGFREEWIAYLSSGVEIGTQHNDTAATAEFALQIATLFRMLSEYDRAMQWLDSSLASFRQQQDRRGEARALNELAWLEQLRRRYDDASQHVEQALALLDEDDPERGMCYRTQGMIAIYLGKWEEAEAHHRAALASFERNGDTRKAAWSMVNLATALRGQKMFELAIENGNEACSHMIRLNDNYHWTIAQSNLGLTYYYAGLFEEATNCYIKAELMANQLHDRLRLADINLNLGLSYLAQNRGILASNSFLTSINLFSDLGITSMVVNSMDGLAMSYIAQHKFEQAIEVLEKAISMLPKIIDAPHYTYYQESLDNHLCEAKAGNELKFEPKANLA